MDTLPLVTRLLPDHWAALFVPVVRRIAARRPVVASPGRGRVPGAGRLLEFSGLLFAVAGAVRARRCWRNAEALAPGSRPFRLGRTAAGRPIPVLDIRMRRRILLGRWARLGCDRAPAARPLGGAVRAGGPPDRGPQAGRPRRPSGAPRAATVEGDRVKLSAE
ncbi:hypothetical protein TR51_12980 [Kitasatospora griseola]|uniref:Uncharacterized protein n=1 Tax=Kitasatospora griseola TaxID=2064 RepID=A0A0D0PX93_KITGR|nr:hypothetical protein [Kitasatospora griseola]KIQ64987.1 hypothetical protein TR51_12980 [Kitasatospora griseola]